jgi:rhamnosyltransferase subunit B
MMQEGSVNGAPPGLGEPASSHSAPRAPLAILSALGSRGDVNPMLAMALALRDAGMHTLVIVAEPYKQVVQSLGLPVEVGLSAEIFNATIRDPNLWHPIRGPRLLLGGLVAESIPGMYDLIARHHQPGNTVLIAHPLDLAARVFRDAHPETPLASVHLAPATLRSYDDPPQLTAGWMDVRRSKPAVRAAYWLADRTLLRSWVEKPLNRFRKTLGLAPVRSPLKNWWYSPDSVMALFPEWYGPKIFQRNIFYCGFPLYDGPETMQQEALEKLLANAHQPFVFTAGSAHVSAAKFFEMAVEWCRRSARPAILLSSDAKQIPANLPESVVPSSYVPLGKLLPHCKAIVHHGGIGTTSQALASGIPQLVCPMAFDQFDNGRKIEILRQGTMIPMRWLNSKRLATALEGLSSAKNVHTFWMDSGAAEVAEQAFASRVVLEINRLLNSDR